MLLRLVKDAVAETTAEGGAAHQKNRADMAKATVMDLLMEV